MDSFVGCQGGFLTEPFVAVPALERLGVLVDQEVTLEGHGRGEGLVVTVHANQQVLVLLLALVILHVRLEGL